MPGFRLERRPRARPALWLALLASAGVCGAAEAAEIDPAAVVLAAWGAPEPAAAPGQPAAPPTLPAPPAMALQPISAVPEISALWVGAAQDRSVDCLAAAIHYEAANEPGFGRQAVAEVVLNRARTPGYPKTVCGVVFQGSERRTGCQFTFTCDGSLRRRPSAAAWAAARRIAEQVMAGARSSGVGEATHYHANYVRPYWSPSLVKITQIGAHIFYRAPGAGSPAPGRAPVIAAVIAAPAQPAPAELVMAAAQATAAQARQAGSLQPWGLALPAAGGQASVVSAW